MSNIVKRTSEFPLLDDFFGDFFAKPVYRSNSSCMRTDIQEVENGYTLDIDVPGFGKEDIKISLENGYLTVEAKHTEEKEDKQAHYLRRERFLGSAARSYYVGDDIAKEDIKATYEKGILNLFIPKQGTNVKSKSYITIE
ncbi:MAG: Hsp20/alpha crystallin family protein [Candidatus Izemoplasmatales bacterium]